MYRKFSGHDRRRFQRLELNVIVIYRVDAPPLVRIQVGDKEIEATMLNLSEGGIALLTKYNLPPWTVLSIKFTLSRIDKEGKVIFMGPMSIRGEIRSNIPFSKDEFRLGICFTDVAHRDKGDISNFVKASGIL